MTISPALRDLVQRVSDEKGALQRDFQSRVCSDLYPISRAPRLS